MHDLYQASGFFSCWLCQRSPEEEPECCGLSRRALTASVMSDLSLGIWWLEEDPNPYELWFVNWKQLWLRNNLFLKGTGVSLHLLVLRLCLTVRPANWDVSMQPVVLVFGFLLCRTKRECVRRSLLGGCVAKMVKTACNVLLFMAHFGLEGKALPLKLWAVQTCILKSHFHPKLVVPLLGEPKGVTLQAREFPAWPYL